MNWLNLYTQEYISSWISHRAGEQKIGDKSFYPNIQRPLKEQFTVFKKQGGQFVLFGINEDLGPQGNLGRRGSGNGYEATIKQFVNFQSNQFLSGSDIFILGDIQTQDIQPDSGNTELIRQAVAKLDDRVIELTSLIIAAGLEPIVIGGGHNNAYGLLTACHQALNTPMSAVNLDPHSDFRTLEGRHSGNGFNYAASEGALTKYHVLGLHELKNNSTNLEQLQQFGGTWHTLQQIWIRRELTLEAAMQEIAQDMNSIEQPVGIELDVDAIAQFPSSAETSAGIPLLDAAFYISYLARHCHCHYLHLAEAAPKCHPTSEQAGYRQVGQSLSELVYAYIQGRQGNA
ncbi:arginase [Shewanella sp. OPT22]|nr:arginase [Shewanella sp. OPT22]